MRTHHEPSRKLGTPILPVAVGLCLLAGCSNNPYPPGQTAGSVLYRAITGDLRTLDPSNCYTLTEAAVADLVYPSYYRYHYLKQNPFVLELNLGATPPKRERFHYPDRKTGKRQEGEVWTFRIKKDLRFQDEACFPGGKGRDITAADFLYAFRRLADPRLNPPCPILPFVEDKVIGMAEYVKENRRKKEAGQPIDLKHGVEGLEADPRDPYSFRVRVNQPYPQLRYLMAMHFTTPIPFEAVEKYGADFRIHPVGCGAYRMTEYSIKRRIVLETNPHRVVEYYPADGDLGDREKGLVADAGKQLPLTDTMIFSFQRENITAWNLFMQGYLDQWQVFQENTKQAIDQRGELSNEMRAKGLQLNRGAAPNINYLAFNMTDPTFGGYTPQKRKLRQAISTAIDAQTLIDLYNQGAGEPALAVIPPGIVGYERDYKNPYREFNMERAKQLLAEAGYRDGVDPKTGERLTLYFDYVERGAATRQLAGLIEKQVEAIGIRFEPRTWRDVIWQDRVDRGEYQMIFYGWYADYPDAENFVFLFYGPNKRPGVNHSAYLNREYDRLFEQMRAMDDGPARMEIIRRMREIVEEDCPWIFVFHDQDLLLNYDWVRNVKPHGTANDLGKYRRVDPALRVQRQVAWNQPNFWPAIGLATFIFAGSIPAARVVRQRRRRKVRRS